MIFKPMIRSGSWSWSWSGSGSKSGSKSGSRSESRSQSGSRSGSRSDCNLIYARETELINNTAQRDLPLILNDIKDPDAQSYLEGILKQ